MNQTSTSAQGSRAIKGALAVVVAAVAALTAAMLVAQTDPVEVEAPGRRRLPANHLHAAGAVDLPDAAGLDEVKL